MFYKLYHISLQFVDVLFQLSIAQKGQQGTINSLADDHYLKWQFSGSLPTFQDIAIPDIDVIAGPGGRGCARQQSHPDPDGLMLMDVSIYVFYLFGDG